MVLDTTGVHTRRALLAGTVGGLVALAARALGHPAAVEAHDADDVHLGSFNTASHMTSVSFGAGTAFEGYSESGVGVSGVSYSSSAVRGFSTSGTGVLGEATLIHPDGFAFPTTGVAGVADKEGTGVYGEAGHVGVIGRSTERTAEHYGVYGESRSPKARGVFGRSLSSHGGTGAWGQADGPGGVGVRGLAYDAAGGSAGYGTGLIGSSGSQTWPAPIPNTGVLGLGKHGRGGVFGGDKAQVRLLPSDAATHPTTGSPGDLFVDSANHLWFCRGGDIWVKLA